MCEHLDNNTINFCPEGVDFATVPVPRTQETLYVSLTCERHAPRIIVGRGVDEPADLDLDQAERIGLALLMAVRAGHDLYASSSAATSSDVYPSAT